MDILVCNFRQLARRGTSVAALSLLAFGAHAQMSQRPAPMNQQGPAQQAPSQQLMQQVLAKRAEIQNLGQELQQIQQETLEANPELAKERDELVTLMDTKMVEAGHDPSASRDKIEDLQGQLQGEELSKSERQELGAELRQEMTTLQQAQGDVMQDQEVQAKRQSLNENLVSAMEEQNPKTEELISDLQTAQREYRQLASRMQQQQGGGMPRGN